MPTSPLEKVRAEMGLTQAELAAAAGVGRPVISRAENGRPPSRYATRLRIAQAVELEPEDLWPAAVSA